MSNVTTRKMLGAMMAFIAAMLLSLGMTTQAHAYSTVVEDVQIEKGATKMVLEFLDSGSQDYELLQNDEHSVVKASLQVSPHDSDMMQLNIKAVGEGGTQVTLNYGYVSCDEDGNEELTVEKSYVFNIHVYKKIGMTMKSGQIKGSGMKKYRNGHDYVSVTSSNTNVVKVYKYKKGDYQYAKFIALKPGTATITWEDGEDCGDGDKDMQHLRKWRVTVPKGYGAIATTECDKIYTGKYYSFKGLFNDYSKYGISIPLASKTGKFVKGTGYKVYKSGKLIKLTKTGKVYVKYKVGATTYKVTLAKVHSVAGVKTAIGKRIKAKAPSYKFKSASLSKGKKYVTVKYTTKYGASSAKGWFADGVFKTKI